jgi:hypothetical protein
MGRGKNEVSPGPCTVAAFENQSRMRGDLARKRSTGLKPLNDVLVDQVPSRYRFRRKGGPGG